MKTTLQMAREAGAGIGTSGRWLMAHTELERLVALARADEREACAKLCEQHGYEHYCGNVTDKLAETIRARGQS